MQKRKMWIYALVSMLVTICISGFGRMSYGILMPFMKESLTLTYQEAGMLATSTAIGYLLMVLWVGILATRWGSKRLVVFGLLLLSTALIILFFVESFIQTLICMVILGVGTAFGYTPLVNIVVGWFPQNRGLMIGFLLSGMGLGTLITSGLIPIFNIWFGTDGWRFLWLIYGVISVGTTFIGLKLLQDPPNSVKNPKTDDRSFLHDVYLHKGVLLVALIYGLIGFAYLIPQSFLFSFILEKGVSEYLAGIIIGIGGFISIFSGPLWGTISDRVGRKTSLRIIFGISGFSVLIPIFWPFALGFMISQIFWGLTLMGMLSLTQALAIEQTHQKYAPVALGYTTIFFASGQILGPGLGGIMIEHLDGIPAALWLCFGLFTLAFVLTTRLKTNEYEIEYKKKLGR